MKYGDWIHQRFESWDMKHIHNVSENGSHYIVGNGRVVMRVIKPCRKMPYGCVSIIGENGLNEFGEPFNYNDYFLPEELD